MDKMPPAAVTVDSIVSFFEDDFADIRCQSSWDFSGKQVYLGDHNVNTVCLALDPTYAVLHQAINRGCELLITHHPLFFNPVKGLNVKKTRDRLIIDAVKNGISILSYHTNLDMAPRGMNYYLLKLLNARDTGIFKRDGFIPHAKLVVFVPVSHEEAILDAVDRAGGGTMGNYRRCAFSARGKGTFTPLEGANPYIGTLNHPETVEEIRIETLLPLCDADRVMEAVIKAHPYETPAIDLFEVKNAGEYGFGRIGEFEKDYTLPELMNHLKKSLGVRDILTNMDSTDFRIRRFAVSSGSGSSLWKTCLNHNVNVLITGDLKHHDALDARQAGICIIDIGHYYSEQIYMKYLAETLHTQFNLNTVIADEQPAVKVWQW